MERDLFIALTSYKIKTSSDGFNRVLFFFFLNHHTFEDVCRSFYLVWQAGKLDQTYEAT